MNIRQRLQCELISGGLPFSAAADISKRITPQLNRFLNEGKMITTLSGIIENVPARLAAAIRENVTARLAATFKLQKTDIAIYNVVNNLLKNNPAWSEEQIYRQATKSFLPKTQGGNLLTIAEVSKNIANRETTRRVLIGGGIAAAVIIAFVVLKKKNKPQKKSIRLGEQMKMTERDFGYEYAEHLNAEAVVSIDEMVSGSVDIPTDDYSAMVDAGIENPNAREYWKGYNDYVRGAK
jgi:hypothetical protein